ncbi:MAG: FAD-dependent thymidylate synthase [Defluviitaleaceae bacterium]|nr:FAD-dependent thymidylate synthase [Defluviitaleaceae bacterium]
MKILPPSAHVLDDIGPDDILRRIERAGRVCYKSEGKAGPGTAPKFVANLIKRGHESVIEHEKLSVLLICDRGVSHEIVRHRLASYSQESTRYCNYAGDNFGGEISFIKPCFWNEGDAAYELWKDAMRQCERTYFAMIEGGAKPEQARSVLPNSLKTELVATMNMRAWRHFLKLRTDTASHPQMRELAGLVLSEFRARIPVLFDDISPQAEG